MAHLKARSHTLSIKKAPNIDCLGKCFDAHAVTSGQDVDIGHPKISSDVLHEVLEASGARFLQHEIADALNEMKNPEKLDKGTVENISNTAPRYLNTEWHKEDHNIEEFNAYQQTYAAIKVLQDSYGHNGMIDTLNLRLILTSVGEELTDDEVDLAFKEIGQSSKGFFQPKKLLSAYHDLALKVGREDASAQYDAVMQEIDSQKADKAKGRQSRILHPGMVNPNANHPESRPTSRAQSEKAQSEKGDEETHV
jgi:hypothetical protein